MRGGFAASFSMVFLLVEKYAFPSEKRSKKERIFVYKGYAFLIRMYDKKLQPFHNIGEHLV